MRPEDLIAGAISKTAAAAARKASKPKSTTLPGRYMGEDSQGKGWVLLPGASAATPVKRTSVEVRTGDTVSVTVGDGRAVIDSNISRPSAGLTTVMVVEKKADEADKRSRDAETTAVSADANASYAGSKAVDAELGAAIASAASAAARKAAQEAIAAAGSASKRALIANDTADRAFEIVRAIEVIDPDRFYIYEAQNEDSHELYEETEVMSLRFGTVEDTRVAAEFTVPHSMSLDGDVIARVKVGGSTQRTVEVYEARGKALLSFMWSAEFSGGDYYTVSLTLETAAVRSQIRENDADNKTIWNRIRARLAITWEEMRSLETWGSANGSTWEELASGTYKTGTWGSIMQQERVDWRVEEPSTLRPVLSMPALDAQMIVYGRGLVATEVWSGDVTISEAVPISLTSGGPSAGFHAALDASAQGADAHGLSEDVGLDLFAQSLALGFSDSLGFGEADETVWADELEVESGDVALATHSWTAVTDAAVVTPELGTDRTEPTVTGAYATVNGAVAFSVSFDGEWMAYDGGWSEGSMGAEALNSVPEQAWSAPMRIRMEMPAGSTVYGLNVFYRTED